MFRKTAILLLLALLFFLFSSLSIPAAGLDDFIIIVKTDNSGSSTDTQFTIPTYGNGYNYSVDCANTGFLVSGQTGDFTCDYGSAGPGTYTIRISGDFPRIYFNNTGDKLKLLSIELWGSQIWNSMGNAFYGCENMQGNAADIPDLSLVTNMTHMFAGASTFNQDIGDWDVSNVTDMSWMFAKASAFNQDIAFWDVMKVTDMTGMFFNASSFNGNITGWHTVMVTSMWEMFWGASSFNQDIGDWNVSSVTNMSYMFTDASTFNQDISNWNVANVTSMNSMFAGASAFNQDIGNWDVSRVKWMDSMFAGATVFNQNIGNWNVANVRAMHHMFNGASSFNQDISHWNVANVETMYNMFTDATSFNQDIGAWNVSSIHSSMNYMFSGATAFSQDLGKWDVSGVTSMADMFSSSNLSTSHYDSLLNGWNSLSLQSSVYFNGGKYYCSGEDARIAIINDYNWTIIDRYKDCSFVITSPSTLSVVEKQEEVMNVSLMNSTGFPPFFSIVGGEDKDRFQVSVQNGTLRFKVAPEYANPADSDGDNVYKVQIKIDNTAGHTDIQTFSIEVKKKGTFLPAITYLLLR